MVPDKNNNQFTHYTDILNAVKRFGYSSVSITIDTYAHFFDMHDKKMVDPLVYHF